MSGIGSGSAWAGVHWARPRGFGFKRNRFGSRRWGPVLISRVIINGPMFHRFRSARRILTFHISTKSSQRVGHDEQIFREIRGPEMIGDFSRGRPRGVGPAVMIFDPPVRSWSSIYGREALDE